MAKLTKDQRAALQSIFEKDSLYDASTIRVYANGHVHALYIGDRKYGWSDRRVYIGNAVEILTSEQIGSDEYRDLMHADDSLYAAVPNF